MGDLLAELLDPAHPLRLDLLLRLLLASVLGGAIGLERELSGKPAGFRTNLLICVGATLLTELSIAVAAAADNPVGADPGRIAAQIVSGIGFLGAGTILQARGSVVGLTTAATLWVVAAIGMAVGARAYVEAIGTTVLVVLALGILGVVEERLIRQSTERVFRVDLAPDPELVPRVAALLTELGFDGLRATGVERRDDCIEASFRANAPRQVWRRGLARLLDEPGVRRITET